MRATAKHATEIGTPATAGTDWMAMGKMYEQEDDTQKAIALYESMLKKKPAEASICDRLMILYRKTKEYKKELLLINTAIDKFTTLLQPSASAVHSKKITSLSKSILKATGLADHKGKLLYQPQPIARWQKRKLVVSRKLNPEK